MVAKLDPQKRFFVFAYPICMHKKSNPAPGDNSACSGRISILKAVLAFRALAEQNAPKFGPKHVVVTKLAPKIAFSLLKSAWKIPGNGHGNEPYSSTQLPGGQFTNKMLF